MDSNLAHSLDGLHRESPYQGNDASDETERGVVIASNPVIPSLI
jgi:hypothetical protein